jgi:hypothetical protein
MARPMFHLVSINGVLHLVWGRCNLPHTNCKTFHPGDLFLTSQGWYFRKLYSNFRLCKFFDGDGTMKPCLIVDDLSV